MKPAIIVIDDFFKSPELLEEESKTIKYMAPKDLSRYMSVKSKYAAGFHRKLNAIAKDKKITKDKIKWLSKESASYRKISYDQVTKNNVGFYAHSDFLASNFIALLYLNRSADCHGGTGFYSHKETGLQEIHYNSKPALAVMKKMGIDGNELWAMLLKDARDSSKWELTQLVKMKYNRMLIYNGTLFHSHVLDFSEKQKAIQRLTFACAGNIS